MPTNDNDPTMRTAMPTSNDPHGQAALLLVESLIHGLCENSTLTAAQAIEIAQRAADVEADMATAADGAGAAMWQAHALLSSIKASLETDAVN